MSIVAAFGPMGSLFFVGSTARQGSNQTNYRVRNLSSSAQYFAWGATSSVSAPVAPTDGNPSANTIGMLPNSVETFTLPPNSWFIAGTATGFEFLPGEGV